MNDPSIKPATRFARLTCRLIGHKWKAVWDGGPKAHGWPSLVCLRCHEPGWQVTE